MSWLQMLWIQLLTLPVRAPNIYTLQPDLFQDLKGTIIEDLRIYHLQDTSLSHYGPKFQTFKQDITNFRNLNPSVELEDAGNYLVYSRNNRKIITSFTIKLGHINRANFLLDLLPREYNVGQTAILRCEIDGSPTPTVTWQKLNGSMTKISAGYVLNVYNFSEEDEGSYR